MCSISVLLLRRPKRMGVFCFRRRYFRRVANTKDGVYEMALVRKGEHPGLQLYFYTSPNLKEFNTRDLYQRHPTMPGHWKHVGRADSIIVLSNEDKLNLVTHRGPPSCRSKHQRGNLFWTRSLPSRLIDWAHPSSWKWRLSTLRVFGPRFERLIKKR